MNGEHQRKVAPLLVVALLIIIAGIVFLVFRPTQQVDAPTVDQSTEVATSTASSTVDGAAPSSATASASANTTTQAPTAENPRVIQGDGFTATIKPVEAETPVIAAFSVRTSGSGSCVFTWDANKATTCDLINTDTSMAVKGVPAKGSVQTSEAGAYQMKCTGLGGKVAYSEKVACK